MVSGLCGLCEVVNHCVVMCRRGGFSPHINEKKLHSSWWKTKVDVSVDLEVILIMEAPKRCVY